jgi:hypothetical protein
MAAFDTLDHHILLSSLEQSFGIQGSALMWFSSYLSERSQFVLVQDNPSSTTPLQFGVPQGSVLGSVLFVLYTTQLSSVIARHSVSHEMFADDTQLHNSSLPDDVHNLVSSLQGCFLDVRVNGCLNTNSNLIKKKLKLSCSPPHSSLLVILFPRLSLLALLLSPSRTLSEILAFTWILNSL